MAGFYQGPEHIEENSLQLRILELIAADETGFADPFHFSRVFRNVLGVSLSEFRNLRA